MNDMLDGARAWVLDVDGCLMRTREAGGSGGTAMPGAADLVAGLHRAGHTVLVCTNASQHPPERYAAHLRAQGIDIGDDSFITAGRAAADHVTLHHPGARVLVVGADGLTEPMERLGVPLVEPSSGVRADVVVVGAADSYTTATVNAAALAADAGAPLYTTVDGPWVHGGVTKAVTMSAAVAHAVAGVTGATPRVVGKPSPALAETLTHRLAGHAGNAVVVGDSLTEVKLARAIGARSVLVLSGATSIDQLDGLMGPEQPDLALADVAELHSRIAPTLRAQQGALR
ncbi:MAG: HAD-IIA family hydrolase [Sciscionella sp.]